MDGGTTGARRRDLLALAAAMGAGVPAVAAARAPSPSRQAPPWRPPDALLAQLPILMNLASLPGLSMAVLENGEIAWRGEFGVLNADSGEPVTADTQFEAASMSKPVFAYAVLKLVDQGRLDLDRPLVGYFRPAYLPADADIDRITARHVLTHVSGLPNWGDVDKPDSLRPAFRPGRFFAYSGEGFFWLQLVVERITGHSLEAFMRATLLDPAGMRRSTYVWDEAVARSAAYGHDSGKVASQSRRDIARRAAPLAIRWGKTLRDWTQEDWLRAMAELEPDTPHKRVLQINTAASLMTTAADYARFLAVVADHAPRADWEISEATRKAMLTPQVAVQDGLPFWWGLGWALERCGEAWRFSHEGNNRGEFTSYAGGDPTSGRGLVVLANGFGGFPLYQRVVRAATGCDQLSFIADTRPYRRI